MWQRKNKDLLQGHQVKIFLANKSEQQYGGGFSWISNFQTAIQQQTISMDSPIVTSDYREATHYLIPSPTMVQRDEVEKAKNDGKKIILRVDNAVRNSRNRNTGMTRMKDFATWADVIIYQSQWAQNYLQPFLGNAEKSQVILNGIDTRMFHPGKQVEDLYMYSRFNRDETKNWEMARYTFSQIYRQNPNARLWIIGQFSPELVEGNFDFYAGEQYKFWGVQEPEMIADLLRQAEYFIYTYFNDACSNSLIEARVSGCKIVDRYGMLKTGGAREIMEKPLELFSLERMGKEYLQVLEGL